MQIVLLKMEGCLIKNIVPIKRASVINKNLFWLFNNVMNQQSSPRNWRSDFRNYRLLNIISNEIITKTESALDVKIADTGDI